LVVISDMRRTGVTIYALLGAAILAILYFHQVDAIRRGPKSWTLYILAHVCQGDDISFSHSYAVCIRNLFANTAHL
jgi:hypothetical protein